MLIKLNMEGGKCDFMVDGMGLVAILLSSFAFDLISVLTLRMLLEMD